METDYDFDCAISIFHLNNPPPPTLDVKMNAASRSRQPFFETGPQVVTSSRAATAAISNHNSHQFTTFRCEKMVFSLLTMIAKLHAPTEARSVQAWHLARPIHINSLNETPIQWFQSWGAWPTPPTQGNLSMNWSGSSPEIESGDHLSPPSPPGSKGASW